MEDSVHLPDAQAMLARLNEWKTQQQTAQQVSVAWLRNVTIENGKSLLEYACRREHIQPSVTVAGFDTIMQEVADPGGPLYAAKPNIVGLWCDLRNLSEQISFGFQGLGQAQAQAEAQRIGDFYHPVIQKLQAHCDARILVHTFSLPALSVDRTGGPRSQWAFVQGLNQTLWSLESEYANVYCVPSEVIQSRLGQVHAFDDRFWSVAQSPFTREFLWEVVQEYMIHIRALLGKTKKCCVVDCDNTLWGGIVGEDGTDGIRIGPTYPGNSFREVQQVLKDLQSRGILLALCSKNDAWLVETVLREHPDMILRGKDFVAQRINWEDKAANIRSIAQELNIGLEHIVFIDDAHFETDLVSHLLPMVDTLTLPEDPTLRAAFLRSYPKWKTVAVSEADQQRTRWYHEERARHDLRASTDDVASYLASLDMVAVVRRNDRQRVARVAELTQRTNQFNLTTRRYTQEAIQEMMDADDVDVLSVEIKDRVGDMGLSACAILRYESSCAVIDSFMLSCRVLGRGVEQVLLKACICLGEIRSCSKVVGTYVPSKRNTQVEHFLSENSFAASTNGGTQYVYEIEGANGTPAVPAWFRETKMQLEVSD